MWFSCTRSSEASVAGQRVLANRWATGQDRVDLLIVADLGQLLGFDRLNWILLILEGAAVSVNGGDKDSVENDAEDKGLGGVTPGIELTINWCQL